MLKIDIIDGELLKAMLISGADCLEKNKEEVNALNVFPVPDGDTGTNMSLTMLSAAKEIKSVNDSIPEIADALSKGSLKGARGNSGVILSQLFRGFSRYIKDYEELNTVSFANAMVAGVETAYKAVMKPVEGTILTVARVTAKEAVNIAKANSDFNTFFVEILKVANDTLNKTPDMLPVLKESGVVDSGGMGLWYIIKGFSHALDEDIDLDLLVRDFGDQEGTPKPVTYTDGDSIKFGYCTEFFIKNLFPYITEDDVEKLKTRLAKLGDSIVVVGDEETIKVHFHTNNPGKGLELALRFGELSNIKIDNMREQHEHISDMPPKAAAQETVQVDAQPMSQYGVVSVCMGEGISSIFKDLSVDYVIEGGQTMNPSIDDILNAVNNINAEEIFILPNNSNIIMSAKQAATMSDKKVRVIPTKSIPQGMSAMLAYNPSLSGDEIEEGMLEVIEGVKTGQITYAVRDSSYNGFEIKEGDIIGIYNGSIVTTGKSVDETAFNLIDKMLEDDDEIVTILHGENVNEESANELSEKVSEKHSHVDVEVYYGGQPLYYYIISIE